MSHKFQINGQTTAGKRLQNEQRKRRCENLQRDQLAIEILKNKNFIADKKEETARNNVAE